MYEQVHPRHSRFPMRQHIYHDSNGQQSRHLGFFQFAAQTDGRDGICLRQTSRTAAIEDFQHGSLTFRQSLPPVLNASLMERKQRPKTFVSSA